MTDNSLIADLEARFRAVAGEDGIVDLGEFRQALGLKDDYCADRLFALVDEDASGSIELGEFVAFAETAIQGDE